MVRVAKHAEAAEALRREACVLVEIADSLPLEVPRPAYHAPRGCPPFSIHRMLVGTPLTEAVWNALPASARERTAREMGAFLRALHAIPTDRAAACRLRPRTARALAAALRQMIGATVLPQLSSEAARRLQDLLAAESSRNSPSPPVLLHADFSPGHVLIDDDSGAITGIIDFGDCALGERARDLIYVLEDFGPDCFHAIVAVYEPDEPDALIARVETWRLLEAVDWAHGGMVQADASRAAEGLQEIRELLDV
ncbi:MAG TPA: phosphotransferase [Gemmatimonadaceae bacterium]